MTPETAAAVASIVARFRADADQFNEEYPDGADTLTADGSPVDPEDYSEAATAQQEYAYMLMMELAALPV